MKRVGGALLTIGAGTVIALAYAHQQIMLIEARYAVEQRAAVRGDMLDQYHILLYNVLTLQAPQLLEQRLARRDVELVSPRRVAWVTSPATGPSIAGTRGAPGLVARGRQWVGRVVAWRATAEAQPGP